MRNIDPYEIRMLNSSDRESFKQLTIDALKKHQNVFMSDWFEVSAKDDEAWNELVAPQNGKVFGIISKADGELVGIGSILKGKDIDYEGTALVTGFFIQKEHTSKGLFTALSQEMYNWSSSQNYKHLLAAHRDGNRVVRIQLLAFGFSEFRRKESLWANGEKADEIFYVKNIEGVSPS